MIVGLYLAYKQRPYESILVSMPPLASWHYRFEPSPGTAEFDLTDYYLKPRDWLNL